MVTVLILTPLPLEFEAVVRNLSGDGRKTEFYDQAVYEIASFKGQHHEYRVIVCEPGMKNVDMALATEKAFQRYQPQIALLVGIAGGVKDVKIGDLLIAKKAYGYESGKEDADGFKSRPAVESFSGELLARAQALSRRDDWKKRTSDGAPDSKVFLGPIAAGDKVVASTDNPTFQRLKLHFNDTLGLEMEAIGFAMAVQPHRDLHALVVRGISDLCAGKGETDKLNWQPLAAERAAGFAFELLWQLDGTFFGAVHNPMTTLERERFPKDLVNVLEQLIAAGRIKDALKTMLERSLTHEKTHRQAILKLSDSWEELNRNIMLGVIRQSEATLERNKIVVSILSLINSE